VSGHSGMAIHHSNRLSVSVCAKMKELGKLWVQQDLAKAYHAGQHRVMTECSQSQLSSLRLSVDVNAQPHCSTVLHQLVDNA
jgi:hypothetical protein